MGKCTLKEGIDKGCGGGGLGEKHQNSQQNKDRDHGNHPPQSFFPEKNQQFFDDGGFEEKSFKHGILCIIRATEKCNKKDF